MRSREKRTGVESSEIKSRCYAGIFDQPIDSGEIRGADPSPNAIGGYYGISWCEYYRDTETGEIYKVYCSDGVNGGKLAYSPEDEAKRRDLYLGIIERSHQEAEALVAQIRISLDEWNVMRGFSHAKWLESARGKCDGKQASRSVKEGLIGHCHGVPVIVDTQKSASSMRNSHPTC